MRDLRKLRSKYEVKLDNRHIAYLLAAELVVVAVFFALGIVVGKGIGDLNRIDRAAMTPQATPEAIEIAAVAATPEPDLYFPEEVIPPPEMTPEETPEPTPEPMVTPEPSAADLAPAETVDPTQVDIGALPVAPKTGDFWTVQVGAYPTKGEAKAMYDRMAGTGNLPLVEPADLGERGTWYRVSVGRYATEAGAKAVALALRQRENIDTWVRYVP
jgi:DedD protein